MARPVIALMTDFGLRDHYVGTMKGVVLGICPEATLVDISHDIPPQDVIAGALELAAAYAYFPAETVFLTVVDPGVGSPRRAVAVEAGPYRFVAPDNGLLSVVLDELPEARVVELTVMRYQRPHVSATFEGRDKFAPAAAWLAAGTELGALGRPGGPLNLLALPTPTTGARVLAGEIMRVDRFGNLVTNIDRGTLDRFLAGSPPDIRVGERPVGSVVASYASAPPGVVCALFSSSDHLEIAVAGGSAAMALAASRGTRVSISRS